MQQKHSERTSQHQQSVTSSPPAPRRFNFIAALNISRVKLQCGRFESEGSKNKIQLYKVTRLSNFFPVFYAQPVKTETRTENVLSLLFRVRHAKDQLHMQFIFYNREVGIYFTLDFRSIYNSILNVIIITFCPFPFWPFSLIFCYLIIF